VSLLRIELLDRLCVYFRVVVLGEGLQRLHWCADRTSVTAAKSLRTRLLLDPEILGRLEIVPKNRDDLEYLVV